MTSVYLDYAATTPVREEVRAAMEPYLADRFGNPSSLHRWGREAAVALEEARAQAAAAIGARPGEILFVRGGTESDNMAVLGSCMAAASRGVRPHLVVSAVEHHAVLEAAEHAERSRLARLTIVPVTPDGDLDWHVVEEALEGGACIVSAMWVNNETGAALPLGRLTDLVVAAGATIHSDASQAVGKVAVDVSSVPVHLLTATGHKIYGPRGTGLLYVRSGTEVAPLVHGGGQERALRPGTEDVAGAVGLATAMELAVASMASEAERMQALRDELEARIARELPDVRVNAGAATRAPHVSSLGVPGIADGQSLLMALDLEGIAVSGGSACASGSGAGSHVIGALYGDGDPYANIRFSFGRGTTSTDVERAASATVAVVRRLRAS